MPRTFNFRLQKILDYRGQVEDQARMVMAKAQRQYVDQMRTVESLKAALVRHEDNLGKQTEPTEGGLWLWRNYRDRLLQDIEKAEDLLRYFAQNLTRAREKLLLASKEKKLLDKLKERQAATYYDEQGKKEQGEFDEMATLRYQPKDI